MRVPFVRDVGSIPGLGKFPGEGNGNPLQYLSLENPMDRGAWWATTHGGHKESDSTEMTASIYIDSMYKCFIELIVEILPINRIKINIFGLSK